MNRPRKVTLSKVTPPTYTQKTNIMWFFFCVDLGFKISMCMLQSKELQRLGSY